MSDRIEKNLDNFLITWRKDLTEYFQDRRIFLNYPWQENVYRDGDKIRIPLSCKVEEFSNMPLGRICSFGAFSYCRTPRIAQDFQLGRYCSVAQNVSLSDQDHPIDRYTTHPATTHPHMAMIAKKYFGKEVNLKPHKFLKPAPEVGHDVWIGNNVMLKRGIKVGNGAILAAHSVVTKDVPPYAIVGGVPAKVIRYRFAQELIDRLQDLKWWDYNFVDLPNVDPSNIEKFIDSTQAKIDAGELKEFNPKKYNVSDDLVEILGGDLAIKRQAEEKSGQEVFSKPPVHSNDFVVWNEWKEEALTKSQQLFCARNKWFTFSKEEIYQNLNGKIPVPKVLFQSRGTDCSFAQALEHVHKEYPGISQIVVKELRGHSSKQVKVLHEIRPDVFFDALNKVEISLEDLSKWLNGTPFLIEESLSSPNEPIPFDFKVYTFKGKPKSVSVFDRNGRKTSITIINAETWNSIPWEGFFKFPNFPNWVEGSHNGPNMVKRAKIAAALAKEISPILHTDDLFCSFDIYVPEHTLQPVLGEITPRPGAIHANRITVDYLKQVFGEE